MTATATSAPRLPGAALATMIIWGALAALAGASGMLLRLPFPLPQLGILAVVIASLVATSTIVPLRAWIEALPLRTLILINAVRFVGIVFLVLGARGQLAQAFADRAGWGDIAAATLALVFVAAGEPRIPAHRALLHAWNAFGALDLVVAVGTAAWVALRGLQPGMDPLLEFPLSLVPLFAVPVLFVGHVFIFRRLVKAGSSRGR